MTKCCEALRVFRRLGDLPWMASTLLAMSVAADGQGYQARAVTLFTASREIWARTKGGPREEESTTLDALVERTGAALSASRYLHAEVAGRFATIEQLLEQVAERSPTA
jgi:hypothetical protein